MVLELNIFIPLACECLGFLQLIMLSLLAQPSKIPVFYKTALIQEDTILLSTCRLGVLQGYKSFCGCCWAPAAHKTTAVHCTVPQSLLGVHLERDEPKSMQEAGRHLPLSLMQGRMLPSP